METTTTDTTATLEDMIATSDVLLGAAKAAQIAYEDHLNAMAKAHGATYTHNSQVFQIRCRKDSTQGRPITYVCKLPGLPKTWLTGRAKKTPATTAATTVAAAAASVVPETGGAMVID